MTEERFTIEKFSHTESGLGVYRLTDLKHKNASVRGKK